MSVSNPERLRGTVLTLLDIGGISFLMGEFAAPVARSVLAHGCVFDFARKRLSACTLHFSYGAMGVEMYTRSLPWQYTVYRHTHIVTYTVQIYYHTHIRWCREIV